MSCAVAPAIINHKNLAPFTKKVKPSNNSGITFDSASVRHFHLLHFSSALRKDESLALFDLFSPYMIAFPLWKRNHF